jgi:hypothetical protein
VINLSRRLLQGDYEVGGRVRVSVGQGATVELFGPVGVFGWAGKRAGACRGGVVGSVVGVLGEEVEDEVTKAWGCVGSVFAGWAGLFVEVGVHLPRDVAMGEGTGAGEEFVEHAAHGVQVATVVADASEPALGRHVGVGAHVWRSVSVVGWVGGGSGFSCVG